MRPVALALVLAVVVSTNPWRWPCECDAMTPPVAAAEMAPDHSCCAGAEAVADTVAPVRMEATCAPGCCDGEEAVLTSLVEQHRVLAERAPTATPSWLRPAPMARIPARIEGTLVLAPRGPPPTAVRLSLLQILTC